jgi:hypothetical protein
MATDEQQQEEAPQKQQSGGGGKGGAAVKAAAAAAATSVAALAARKAWSSRGDSNGQSRNGGSGSGGGDTGTVFSSMLTTGLDAARDALLPAAEDAAGAAGEYLAKNGPEIIRERIVPRFIESFNEAQGGS